MYWENYSNILEAWIWTCFGKKEEQNVKMVVNTVTESVKHAATCWWLRSNVAIFFTALHIFFLINLTYGNNRELKATEAICSFVIRHFNYIDIYNCGNSSPIEIPFVVWIYLYPSSFLEIVCKHGLIHVRAISYSGSHDECVFDTSRRLYNAPKLRNVYTVTMVTTWSISDEY